MPRWEYDTVFYRVFCITLLGLALTFTVILTNVFIDIDGLLSKTNKANTEHLEKEKAEELITNMGADNVVYDFKDYPDAYDMERTKRSLEPQDFSVRIKDPQMKQAVTNRLAALLEELDKGKSRTIHNEKANKRFIKDNKQSSNAKYTNINDGNPQGQNVRNKNFRDVELLDNSEKFEDPEELDIINDIDRLKKEKVRKQMFNQTVEELKHLTMHNIILQGIVEHMDLGDVYAKVHSLMNNLETPEDDIKGIMHAARDEQFLNELMHCKQLHTQIDSETSRRKNLETQIAPDRINKKTPAKSQGRNVMIKTIIDISSLTNGKSNPIESSRENINGIVKLIYNGKSLKFKRIDEATTINPTTRAADDKYLIRSNVETVKDAEDKILGNSETNGDTYVPKIYMKRIINHYLNRYSKESDSFEDTKKSTTKRLKRHISIRYENEDNSKTTTESPKNKGRKGEDELFVEIETHFDSKGLHGEKKKKMIRDLIGKIQKAIHSNRENEKKKRTHLRVKKRTQNPLDSETASPLLTHFKMALPIENTFQHRELDPIISKSARPLESLPHVADSKGDDWKKYNDGPRFLTPSKGINSVEMGELDSDYNKLLKNGIPQRLQKPLNTNDELKFKNIHNQEKETYNLDKENHVIMKDIAGSGFTIGYNQYVAEAPDLESMKLFTGIENIIKEYHQKYDEGTDDAVNSDVTNPESISPTNSEQYQEKPLIMIYPAPEKEDHSIVRRSIKNVKTDYHSNEYNVIYNKNFLNYKNYQDIYNNKGHWSKAKTTESEKAPFVLDENVFKKALKPAEIFSLADFLGRKKRSLHHVRRITNIRNKKKLQTFLNTNSMASRKIFQNNKRNKRQINKIRIIAKDISKTKHNSEEDIFVLSDEKVFADRALVREVETPVELNEDVNEEHFDVIAPQTPQEERFDLAPQHVSKNHYDIFSPYAHNDLELEANNDMKTFFEKSRHNSLMSRYPHIFMQEIAGSKEDLVPDNALKGKNAADEVKASTQGTPTMVDIPQTHADQKQYVLPTETEAKYQNPETQEIIDHYPVIPGPSQERSNYKVTVKILPKNTTGINSGFKEIHTSINKSYNKNGLVYTSLVNVSEISKIDKYNKTQESNRSLAHPAVKKLQIEQMRMKSLIQQHKDRIDDQIVHLTKEKEKLNRMDFRNAEFLRDVPTDLTDSALHKNSAASLRITQEQLQELLNYRDTMRSTTTTTTTTTTSTTETPITITDTTTAKQTTATESLEHTEDPDKIKIFNTIAKNEMITNQLLTRIDKNADILQSFFNKIIAKLESTTQKPSEVFDREKARDIDPLVQRTNEILGPIPNLLFNHKNGQETPGIPFVYAFQQPYNTPNGNNKDTSIANVVYQGHIHSQPINKPEHIKKVYEDNQKRNEWKPSNTKPDIKNNNKIEIGNGTKFFIDDLDDGKPIFTRISVNNTKV